MKYKLLQADPFPLMIVEDFYWEEELALIWEELDFFTNPGKLLTPNHYGGAASKTNSRAVQVDSVFSGNSRRMSNLLRVNRKLFQSNVLLPFRNLHDCCWSSVVADFDITKLRYYHNGEGYAGHRDPKTQFLACTYFYREPRKFEGGGLRFPKYDQVVDCGNNTLVVFPGWVQHEVMEVSIKDDEYLSGNGRYCMTQFFGKDMANTNSY